MIRKTHHYFEIINRSLPLLRRIRAFNFIVSLLFLLKLNMINLFFFRLINLILVSFLWWVSYRDEINLEGSQSFSLETGLKISMLLFISSEVFFFFSFFWSYFHFFLAPRIDLGLSWPPFSITAFECLNVPIINTLVLLSSGVTITVAHHFLIESKLKWYILFLFLTVILGLIFTLLQGIEYQSAFFSLRDRTFGTSFFILTGFHGIHVIIGTLFLRVCLYRRLAIIYSDCNILRFEIAAWYWHFVDVVWIFLYFFLYYINN